MPFSKIDCNNEIGRQRKKYLEANDAQTLLKYLKNKQIEDPSIFYAIQNVTPEFKIYLKLRKKINFVQI